MEGFTQLRGRGHADLPRHHYQRNTLVDPFFDLKLLLHGCPTSRIGSAPRPSRDPPRNGDWPARHIANVAKCKHPVFPGPSSGVDHPTTTPAAISLGDKTHSVGDNPQ